MCRVQIAATIAAGVLMASFALLLAFGPNARERRNIIMPHRKHKHNILSKRKRDQQQLAQQSASSSCCCCSRSLILDDQQEQDCTAESPPDRKHPRRRPHLPVGVCSHYVCEGRQDAVFATQMKQLAALMHIDHAEPLMQGPWLQWRMQRVLLLLLRARALGCGSGISGGAWLGPSITHLFISALALFRLSTVPPCGAFNLQS